MRDHKSSLVFVMSIGVILCGLLLVAGSASAQHPATIPAPGRGVERKHMAPPHIEEAALSLVAGRHGLDIAKLKVVGSNQPNFPLTGVVAYQIMIIGEQNQEPYSVTLDEKSNELDLEKLYENERAAYVVRYGRFEPRLAERLKRAGPDDLIPVFIEPRFPPERPDRPKYPLVTKEVETWDRLPEEEKDRIRKLEADYERRLDSYLRERANQASAPVIKRLAQLGYEAKADKLTGTIRASLKPDIIKELTEWEDVRHLSLALRPYSPGAGRKN